VEIPRDCDVRAFRDELEFTNEGLAKAFGQSVFLLISWMRTGRASAAAVAFLKTVMPQVRAARLAEIEAAKHGPAPADSLAAKRRAGIPRRRTA
jgi:hypothetical protein